MNRYSRSAVAFAPLFVLATRVALAQQASPPPGGACTDGGLGLSQYNNVFSGYANWLFTVPAKYGLLIGAVIMLLVLLFDGGQMPQIARLFLIVLLVVISILTLIAWVGGQNFCAPTA